MVVDFNYRELLSGEGTGYWFDAKSNLATFASIWLVLSLLYCALVLIRNGLWKRSVIFIGLIMVIISAVSIFNVTSLSSSVNDVIQEESASRYEGIQFEPYSVADKTIEDYYLDDHAYITAYTSGIVELKTYFVTDKGKKDRNFSISQIEFELNESPSEMCDDLTGNIYRYHPTSKNYKCIKIGDTNYSTPVYFLQPDDETLQKKYARGDAGFTEIGNRLIIIEVNDMTDPEDSKRLILNTLSKFEQFGRKDFFEQFRQIDNRKSDW